MSHRDVPIPPLHRRARTVLRAFSILARDTSRVDQVLELAQAVNLPRLVEKLGEMESDPALRSLLDDMPRIDRASVDYEALGRLPDGTLGREYARFLVDHGISPSTFEKDPDVGNARLAYLITRVRQTHDLWHVLTGYEPDVRGEVLLQGFTYGQLRMPSNMVIALFGIVRYGLGWPRPVRHLRAAIAHGGRAAMLAGFRWEDHWDTPLVELRERLACPSIRAA